MKFKTKINENMKDKVYSESLGQFNEALQGYGELYSKEEFDRVYPIVVKIAVDEFNQVEDQWLEEITDQILSDNGEGLTEEEIREQIFLYFEDNEEDDFDESLINALGTMTPDQLQKAELRRDRLWDKEDKGTLTPREKEELETLSKEIEAHYNKKKELSKQEFFNEDNESLKESYNSCLSIADKDAKKFHDEWLHNDDITMADILISLGYESADDVRFYKEFNDGNAIVFDFAPYEDEYDYIYYYVIDEDNNIPKGYTKTRLIIDEEEKYELNPDNPKGSWNKKVIPHNTYYDDYADDFYESVSVKKNSKVLEEGRADFKNKRYHDAENGDGDIVTETEHYILVKYDKRTPDGYDYEQIDKETLDEAKKDSHRSKYYKGMRITLECKGGVDAFNVYDEHGELYDSGFKSLEAAKKYIDKEFPMNEDWTVSDSGERVYVDDKYDKDPWHSFIDRAVYYIDDGVKEHDFDTYEDAVAFADDNNIDLIRRANDVYSHSENDYKWERDASGKFNAEHEPIVMTKTGWKKRIRKPGDQRHTYLDIDESLCWPNGKEATIDDITNALMYQYGISMKDVENSLSKNEFTEDQIQRALNYYANNDEPEVESLKEDTTDKWAVVDDASGDIIDVFSSKDEAKEAAAENQNLKDDGMFIRYKGPFVVEPYYESLKEDTVKPGIDLGDYGLDEEDPDFEANLSRLDLLDDEDLTEDTVKQNKKWVNKGKEGTHGKFRTKKEADAQRRAIWVNWNKESLEEARTKKPNPEDIKVLDSGYASSKEEFQKIKKEQIDKYKKDYPSVKCELVHSDTKGQKAWETYCLKTDLKESLDNADKLDLSSAIYNAVSDVIFNSGHLDVDEKDVQFAFDTFIKKFFLDEALDEELPPENPKENGWENPAWRKYFGVDDDGFYDPYELEDNIDSEYEEEDY